MALSDPLPGCRLCPANGLLDEAPEPVSPSLYMLPSRDPDLAQAVMLIPFRHVETPFELTAEEFAEMPRALSAARAALARHAPDGYTIGWNVGAAGGQSVFHVHLHVIARRWDGPHAGRGLRVPLKLPDGAWG